MNISVINMLEDLGVERENIMLMTSRLSRIQTN